ncbi:hypothetical protein B0A52_02823 [Exophiala mesophila]|uniref:Uncharacterized protein n=1 Tax=Exophiala mesophila TaxID=212818 RepID=A0A438NDQ9_EXOME|nr:hypothetical protein B0A52_02823 [Exophiala mesophila]
MESLNDGISGGYIDKDGVSPRLRLERKLLPDECGYFTFIPILKESCGTYTKAIRSKNKCKKKHKRTTANACALQLVDHDTHGPDGVRVIRGIAAFVRHDCSTLELLPDSAQDAAFTTEGVRLSRQSPVWDAYEKMLRLPDHDREEIQSGFVYCDITRTPNAQDCVNGFEYMFY